MIISLPGGHSWVGCGFGQLVLPEIQHAHQRSKSVIISLPGGWDVGGWILGGWILSSFSWGVVPEIQHAR